MTAEESAAGSRPAEADAPAVLRAVAFAAERHRHQRRKGEGGIPYINHPIEVAELVARHGADRTTVIAAILHDTIEDTSATACQIEQEFGEEVARVVLELTDDKSLPRSERKRLQIEKAPRTSSRAKLVKLADKIANLASIRRGPPGDWSVGRQREYFDWAREVVAGLRGVSPPLERLFDEIWAAGVASLPPPEEDAPGGQVSREGPRRSGRSPP